MKPDPNDTPRPASRPAVPDALADVALIDGPTAAAAAGLSVSSWLERVASGEAPPPAIRAPRFTRWRMSDVRRYLIELPQRQSAEKAAAVVALARKGSRAAAEKRARDAEAAA